MNPRAFRLLFVTIVAGLAPLVAGAAVITVTTTSDELNIPISYNGQCSLREAIQSANTDASVDSCTAGSGADTILVPAGSYLLTIAGAGEDANQTGDLDITEDLEIAGDGPSDTFIEQTPGDRILHVQCDSGAPAAVAVTVRDLLLTKGGVGEGAGGGVFAEDCAFPVDLSLERLDVFDNIAGFDVSDIPLARPGGGIGFDSDGTLTVRDTLIRNNGFFQANTDFGSFGGGGIGITGGGNAVIEDSHLLSNRTSQFFSAGDPSGGAIWTDAITEIRGTTFETNFVETEGLGGALYCESTLLSVDNSTFFDNRGNSGGAFANGHDGASGCITLFDSVTITGNTAVGTVDRAGGIFNETGGVSVTNSIVAGNDDNAGGARDVFGTFTSGDHNLIGAIDGSTGFTEPDDLTGTAASPLDPVLGALGAEGFAVPTIAPAAGSPALDSGGSTALTLDQRGLPRASFGIAPERGAAEVLNANYGVYLDVSTSAGAPGSAYAAAATASGVWNSLDLGGPAPLLDRLGGNTGVTATLASGSAFSIPTGATDAARLFIDDARDCSLSGVWSVDFAGLPDADYLALLYAPENAGHSTGDVLVGGLPMASLSGDTLALDADVSFSASPEFTLSGGSLSISGSNPPGTDCAGIAGVQLLPEPSGWLPALACALLLAGLALRESPGR